MGREPCDRSRLRLFSKAPLAEVLKEEGEEPLGKTPWGLPLERLKKQPTKGCASPLPIIYYSARELLTPDLKKVLVFAVFRLIKGVKSWEMCQSRRRLLS